MGAGSFYSVQLDNEVVEARARGRLKNDKVKLLIGDKVVLEKESDTYAITEVLPRKNCLIRPAVANVDQIIVVIAAASPNPNFKQIDKLLCLLEYEGLDVKICINKTDLIDYEELVRVYKQTGYEVITTSAVDDTGFDLLKDILKDKVTAFAGCSGVGKSSLINAIDVNHNQIIGSVGKMQRGRHTTTHASLLPLDFGGFIADTPGFSVVDLTKINKNELDKCFIDISKYIHDCKFMGCAHIKEAHCEVIRQLKSGNIEKSRYESYVSIYEELANLYQSYK